MSRFTLSVLVMAVVCWTVVRPVTAFSQSSCIAAPPALRISMLQGNRNAIIAAITTLASTNLTQRAQLALVAAQCAASQISVSPFTAYITLDAAKSIAQESPVQLAAPTITQQIMAIVNAHQRP